MGRARPHPLPESPSRYERGEGGLYPRHASLPPLTLNSSLPIFNNRAQRFNYNALTGNSQVTNRSFPVTYLPTITQRNYDLIEHLYDYNDLITKCVFPLYRVDTPIFFGIFLPSATPPNKWKGKEMNKIQLGRKQTENLLTALDIAVNSYYTGEQFADEDAKDRKIYEDLRATIERQLAE